MRRRLRPLSTVLIAVGALLLADAVVTLVWQEPLSALYGRVQQGKLEDKLSAIERTPLAAVDQRALSRLDARRRLAFAARALARRSEGGDPLGRIRIPEIGVSDVFVEGTGTADLRKGPGHYPATPLPGQRGTIGIAGHRTTYGAPFHDVDDLRRGPGHYPATPLPGQRGTVGIAGHRTTYGAPFRRIDKVRPRDEIVVTMPYGTFTYRVERTRIVKPTAVWVTDRVSFDRLILSACHPLYSAAKRIVVFARLERARARFR